MKATKKQLRQEIKELRNVGNFLSNIAYNLSQDAFRELDPHTKGTLKKCYVEWDAIKRSEKP